MAAKVQAGAGTAALVLTLLVAGRASATCSLSDLAWVTGDWTRVAPRGVTREQWIVGPAGEMLGFSWGPNYIYPGDVVQIASITDGQGPLALRQRNFDAAMTHASEERDDPITFSASSCGPRTITFDGVGKWTGGHTTYSRDGETLTVEGIVRDNGQHGHYKVVFKKE